MDFNLTDPENGPVLDDSLPNSVHEYVSWNFFKSEYVFEYIRKKKPGTYKQMHNASLYQSIIQRKN